MKLILSATDVANAVVRALAAKNFSATAENIEFTQDSDGNLQVLAEVSGSLLDEPKEVKTRKPRTPKAAKAEGDSVETGEAATSTVAGDEPAPEPTAESETVTEAPKKKLFGSKPAAESESA